MRFKNFLYLGALCLFCSLFFSESASAGCASAKPGILGVNNYILVQKGPNLPPAISAAADAAATKWVAECGTGKIPEFWTKAVNPPGGAAYSIVNVLYDGGVSPSMGVCGEFSGSNITIYEYYRKVDNSVGRCTQFNLTDIVAHEYGHRLGLNDAGGGAACEDNIMASVNNLGHSVSSEECAAADHRNSTVSERNSGCETAIDCHMSPIVFNLDHGPWELTGLLDGVEFDYDGDGQRTRTGWTPEGRRMAFLFTDLDGDGCASSGRELFGDSMTVPEIGTYLNGFEALMPWDSDEDGWISPADSGWSRLRLWTDLDHNGSCTEDEVKFLVQEGIIGIDLNYREHHRRDRFGNEFRLMSRALFRGRDGRVSLQRVFDIYFVASP